MTTLRISPWSLADLASVKIRVVAFNSIGDSITSDVGNGATIPIADVNPEKPNTFVRDDTLTTKTQVSFSWSAPVDNGGSSVLDYEVEMDDNNDNIYTVVATGLVSTAHIETGLSAGNLYRFRVRARNAVDYSDYSNVFTI